MGKRPEINQKINFSFSKLIPCPPRFAKAKVLKLAAPDLFLGENCAITPSDISPLSWSVYKRVNQGRKVR